MRQPITISYLIPSLQTGGAENQLRHLLKMIDRSRFLPDVVVFEETGRDIRPIPPLSDVFALHIPPAGNSHIVRSIPCQLLGLARLLKHLRRTRPQVVHAFLPAAAIVGGLAASLARVPAFVVSRRSMLANYRKTALLATVDRFALRFARAVAGNCQAVTAEARECDRFPAGRCYTIYNGVDTTAFAPRNNREARRRLGFLPDDVVFGTVANFRDCKRHIDLVDAAAMLGDRTPHIRYLLAGADYGTRDQVAGRIAQKGLAGQFSLIESTASPQMFYDAMDVYVCSSSTEGFSNSILEAMASGKPVVATSVGGNREIVRHGETGFLVPPSAPANLAGALEILAKDADRRRRMGLCGRCLVQERFSLAGMVRGYEQLYMELLASA